MLLLIKKHTDTHFEQTKTKPQGTLEYKMNKQMETFSFNPPINFVEEGKWLSGVTSFKKTNSVFNITDENNSFSISAPRYWSSRGGAVTFDKLQKFLELRSQNDIKLHLEDVRKRANLIKKGENEYKVSDLDNHKNDIIG